MHGETVNTDSFGIPSSSYFPRTCIAEWQVWGARRMPDFLGLVLSLAVQ